MQIYQVDWKVRPSTEYRGDCLLRILIFAEERGDARYRAELIVNQFPFEKIVEVMPPDAEELTRNVEECVSTVTQAAKSIGFGFMFGRQNFEAEEDLGVLGAANRHLGLYLVTLKIRPSSHHPGFSNWNFGYIGFFIFAESREDAELRVKTIINQLPFNMIDGEACCTLWTPWAEERFLALVGADKDTVKQAAKDARQTGMSFVLAKNLPGQVEAEWLS